VTSGKIDLTVGYISNDYIPSDVRAALVRAATLSIDWSNRYPSTTVLKKDYGAALEVEEDQLVFTAGADGALRLLFGQTKDMDDRPIELSVCFTPTYRGYGDLPGIVQQPSFNGTSYVIDTSERPAVGRFFVASPNNPAGDVPLASIAELAASNPQAIVVVDEAHVSFKSPSYSEFDLDHSAVSLLATHPNIAVVRSFSKAYALAGARVGAIVASKEICSVGSQYTAEYAVSGVSIAHATAALRRPEPEFMKIRSDVLEQKRETVGRLQECGYGIVEGSAAMIVVKFDEPSGANAFTRAMGKQGFTLNPGAQEENVLGMPANWVRIGIGSPAAMRNFRDVLPHLDHVLDRAAGRAGEVDRVLGLRDRLA
jgi:histidinol-phosphate/aromatic aminotransferase/cobyric acid decarboxylase-like protein